MNIFQISTKNIRSKSLSATLSILLFATGVFIVSFLLLVKKQVETHLEKNVAGINMVVGAKGSPLQLVLSSIYHVDYPTGNISYAEAQKLSRHPLIAKTIPLALGDNFHGYRIVGTTHDYAELYKANLSEGSLWSEDLEVTIGAKVAKETGLRVGDRFAGMHGFIEESHSHDDFKYLVTGIFESNGSVIDQLILTNIGSVWRVHEHEGEANDSVTHVEESVDKKEITSLLVFFRNALGAITLPRYINQQTNMQAASPAVELNRLYSLMGTSIQTLSFIAYLIIFISGLSIFISLFNAMKDRKYELALIRVMGGGKKRLFSMVITEGVIIAVLGFLIGTLLSKCALFAISAYAEESFHYGLNVWKGFDTDFLLLACSLVIGILASILPAIKAVKTDISRTLSE